MKIHLFPVHSENFTVLIVWQKMVKSIRSKCVLKRENECVYCVIRAVNNQ